MKRVTNLLHLVTGIALLALAAYSLRGLAHGGKTLWRQQASAVADPVKSGKSPSASVDPLAGAASVKVYGVLGQHEAAAGDDADPAASSGSPSMLEYVNAVDAGVPNHFLHRRLSLVTFQIFEFEVPPRAIHPELRGTFLAVATRRNPDSSVEVWLMNDRQFARFVDHQLVNATFSSPASSRGQIDWELTASPEGPRKYYLVFRNASKGQGANILEADFTASFE